MDVQQQSGSSSPPPPPPFLTKTYDMVDDPETDSVVSWSMGGNSFVVWNQAEFSKELLPKYFKHSNFSSFVRQLNTYGFRKSDPDQWEFANDEFIRGQRDLLKNIHRRKPMHSHSLHHPQGQGSLSGSLFDAEKQELEEERENLKRETHVLMMELRKNTQQQHKLDEQVQSVNERFQLIGFHHREMFQRMDQVIRNPDFVSQMLQLTEFYKLFSAANKKRKLPENDHHSYGEENQIIGKELVSNEELDVRSMNAMNVEAVDCLESSMNSWEELMYRVGRSSSLETDYVSTPFQLSSVVLTEIPISSENTDTSSYSQSPNPRSSSRLTDIHSSPELAESTTQGESGTFSTVELTHGRHNMDPQLSAGVQHKSSGIDMNSVPASLEVQQSAVAKDTTGTAAKARVNDVFWEQFLTETPGRVVDNQEVQSEMRSGDDKRVTRSDSADLSRNKRNVDYLTRQMGQLTPTEKA